MRDTSVPPVAVVTGASQGLGFEVAARLAAGGWSVVIDARDPDRLGAAATAIAAATAGGAVRAVAGDVTDAAHRAALVDTARALGDVRLVVNNASTLGASPLPRLDAIDDDTLRRIFDVNVVAPLALVRDLTPHLASGVTIVEVTSDAAAEAYVGWGGYGASKAALEHAGRVLAEERPDWHVLVVDPGDMRTQMHQDAFPGEDISDRPEPGTAAAALLALVEEHPPSGRYVLTRDRSGAQT